MNSRTEPSLPRRWCCRLCDHCRKEVQSRQCHSFLLITTIALVVAGVVLIILGFSADRKQSDAMQSLPTLVRSVELYTHDVRTLVGVETGGGQTKVLFSLALFSLSFLFLIIVTARQMRMEMWNGT